MRTDTSYSKTFRKMLWFMALLLVVFTAGCDRDHGAEAPPSPPTVTFTVPANGDTGVAINRKITASFSEAMDPATITTAAFKVTGPLAIAITGTVTYAGSTAVFTPSSALATNSLYIATITTVVKNQEGIAMAANYTWSFTTGLTADTTAPTLISTGASDGDTDLPINRNSTATFSEPMDPATLASPATSFTLKEFVSGNPVTGVVTYLGNIATFNPDSNLLPNTKYTSTITTGAKDLAGNALVSGLRANPWSWTTGSTADTTAPTVTLTSPADLATNEPVDKKITTTFSEAMNPATMITANFKVKETVSGNIIPGTVSYDVQHNIAIFSPLINLTPGTDYTVTVTNGAKDLAGNALASNFVWSFTTAVAPVPTVTSTVPANGDTGVQINRRITARFSEAMDPATLVSPATSFTLKEFLSGNSVSGVVTYAGETAIFTPSSALATNKKFTATITTMVNNQAGIAMAANYTWSFTTGLTADTTAPTLISTGAFDGETNLPINRNSTATFSEPMDPATLASPATSFTLKEFVSGNPVTGVVTYLGNIATFNPDSNLLPNTKYTSTITTGAKDLVGNALIPGLRANPWSWTTSSTADTTAPTVTLTNPADLATNVPVDKKINATFSEAMNPATMITANFKVKETVLGTDVPGTVVYDVQMNIAIFSPLTNLTSDTDYTVTVTNGAKDLAGNALVVPAVGGLPKPNPWTFRTVAIPGPAIVINLNLASPFAIAAAAGMTNTPTVPVTTVNGDVVLTPTATCNGVASPGCGGTAPVINGTLLFGADPAAIAVRADLLAAYNSITPASLPGAIVLGCGTIGSGGGAGAGVGCAGNSTLPPGVYISATASTIGVTGVLTLDGQGDANSQFILQAPSALTTAAGAPGLPGSEIKLINGARASNVWWWVGSSATIGTYAIFQGNVLADTSITMGTGSTSCGRLLAGAVTASGAFVFDSNVVSVPGNGCPL